MKPYESDLSVLERASPGPVELTLDQCIKCNICVTECPVVPVTDLFPGPKYEGPQGARYREPGQATPDDSVDYCSGCRVCNMVCPTGVRIAEINARARNDIVRGGEVGAQKRLRNNLVARPETLGKLAQPLAPLANAVLGNGGARWLVEKTLGIAKRAPLPTFAGRRFSRWFRGRKAALSGARKIVYFHGCSTEYYEPGVGEAAVYVLEANGFEVVVPPQNCCGLPLLSNGEFDAAQGYHDRNVASLAEYVRQGYVIVGTSTSCTLTLKEEAPELLDDYRPDSRLVAANTFDFNEFLVLLAEAGELKRPERPVPARVAYHPPCQYRAHRVGVPSAEIMALIPGLEIVMSPAACCGVAGTYGYKEEKYQIAMDVGRPLFEFIAEVNGPFAVCDSETCRWQITGATGVAAVHPVALLARSYGWESEIGQ